MFSREISFQEKEVFCNFLKLSIFSCKLRKPRKQFIQTYWTVLHTSQVAMQILKSNNAPEERLAIHNKQFLIVFAVICVPQIIIKALRKADNLDVVVKTFPCNDKLFDAVNNWGSKPRLKAWCLYNSFERVHCRLMKTIPCIGFCSKEVELLYQYLSLCANGFRRVLAR